MNPPRKSSSGRSSHEREAAPITLDYNHLWRLCLKYWKWLTAGAILGFLAGYFYAASQTPIYSARSTIVVNSKSNGGPDAVGQPDGISDDMIKTYEQLLQTKDLAQRVVKAQHLNEDPDFLPGAVGLPVSEDTATGILASETHIQIRPLTRLIDITVEHPSPEMTAKLANWLAQAAISQQVDQSAGTTTVLSDYLQKEVERIQGELAQSESALKAYDASHNIMEGNANDAVDANDNELKDLNMQYEDAQAQVSLLEERYGPEHPKLIAAENLVDELRNKLNKAQSNAVSTSGQDSDYSTLKQTVNSYKDQLASMLKELQGAQAAAHVEIPGIAVADEATRPWVPVRPNKTRSAAVGGFIGLVCGLSFVLGVYFLDSSIRTVSQAESTLGLPVIAAIPILTEADGRSVLPTYSDPQSFVAESFRGLRASLILHDRANPLKTVLVGSAVPGEGKSFCAANLAVAFAQAGLKTLLIDADLRLPTLHTYFNIPADQVANGFLEVLSGRATLDTAAIASPIPTLSLLLTTTAADAPAELLSGIRLPLLLDQAAQKYDRVVIDSAPLNAVSDTMLILQKTDAILLVIRAAQTPSSESKAALQKIYSSNMKPLGLILNYLAAHTLKSYAYGYSYGQKPKDKNAR